MSPSALAELRREPSPPALAPIPPPVPATLPAEPVAPVSHDGRRVSEEEYWRDYYDESNGSKPHRRPVPGMMRLFHHHILWANN